jgi:hypothetical protein
MGKEWIELEDARAFSRSDMEGLWKRAITGALPRSIKFERERPSPLFGARSL